MLYCWCGGFLKIIGRRRNKYHLLQYQCVKCQRISYK